MKNLLVLHMFLCVIFCSYSQLIGGRENGQEAPTVAEPSKLTGGSFNGDVNIFTGQYHATIPLGTVSTPSGLSYSLELNRTSSYSFGDNEPLTRGILYGDGWNLNIPTITSSISTLHRFSRSDECNDQIPSLQLGNTNTSIYPDTLPGKPKLKPSDEGDLYWFDPYIDIPGVASGRAIFKYVDVKNQECSVFALNSFDSPIEIRFYGSSWTVTDENGNVYVFESTSKQFMAPTNKRQLHYNHQNAIIEPTLSGVSTLIEGEYPAGINDVVLNAIEPKLYYNVWYCSRIFNPNYIDQNIMFTYDKYGAFNFFKEFQQSNYRKVHEKIFNDRSFNFLPDYTVYRDIILKDIVSTTIDGEHYKLVLEYDYEIVNDINVMNVNDASVTMVDSLYFKKTVVQYGENKTPFSNWYRYKHVSANNSGNSSDKVPSSDINPYLDNGFYNRHQVGSLNSNAIPFSHGFLESPRINTNNINFVPGELYEIKCKIGRANPSSLKNGNGTIDIAIVTNGKKDVVGDFYESVTNIQSNAYNDRRGEKIFSTFNMGLKWMMGFGESQVVTSNLFVMPDLPTAFGGFNIQVGPGNSDIVYSYNETELYTFINPETNSTTSVFPNAKVAYPQLTAQGSLKSSARIPSNFGTGHPWGLMYPIYNLQAYGEPLLDPDEHLYRGTWFKANVPNATLGKNNPTKFNDSISLMEVEVTWYAKVPFMLKAVKLFKAEGERDNAGNGGRVLLNQKAFEYQYKIFTTRENRAYEVNAVVNEEGRSRGTFLLRRVDELPLNAITSFSNYGLTDSTKYHRTSFDYENILPLQGVFDEMTNPSVGKQYFILKKIHNNIGGVTTIEYNPHDHATTHTISLLQNGSDWCDRPQIPSYGKESAFSIHFIVKKVNYEFPYFDETTNVYTTGVKTIDYDYSVDSIIYKIGQFALNPVNFRGTRYNYATRGFKRVTVTEPKDNPLDQNRNYTVYHHFGRLGVPTSNNQPTIEEYLYTGKIHTVKNYNSEHKLQRSKEYIYGYTLAHKDGIDRPNFRKESLYAQGYLPTMDYEYRDYYTNDMISVPSLPNLSRFEAQVASAPKSLTGNNFDVEYPKYLPLYFSSDLRTRNNDYKFHSYFVKLVKEIDRNYENALLPIPDLNVYSNISIYDEIYPTTNPFNDDIVITNDFNAFTIIWDSINNLNSSNERFEYLLGLDNLEENTLKEIIITNLLHRTSKGTLLSKLGGVPYRIWEEIFANWNEDFDEEIFKIAQSQAYFTDSTLDLILYNRGKHERIITEVFNKNKVNSDEILNRFIRTIYFDNASDVFKQVLLNQERIFHSELLNTICESPLLNNGNIVEVLTNQNVKYTYYNKWFTEQVVKQENLESLLKSNAHIIKDSVLISFINNRLNDINDIEEIVMRLKRPIGSQLELSLAHNFQITYDAIFNPLEDGWKSYCNGIVQTKYSYIENVTEYDYYEADYTGKAIGRAYEVLFGKVSSVKEPSPYPMTIQTEFGLKVINNLNLKHEPSWQLFSKTSTSPHLDKAYNREEYFYLYDLFNRYYRYWYNYDHTNQNFDMMIQDPDQNGYVDTLLFNQLLNSEYHYDSYSTFPIYEGMNKAQSYKLKNVPFQVTNISNSQTEKNPTYKSTYFFHDNRWKFDDALPKDEITENFAGPNCPDIEQNENEPCVYAKLVSDNILQQLKQQYPSHSFCFYKVNDNPTNYMICPKNQPYDGAFLSNDCDYDLDGGALVSPTKQIPIGSTLSRTLELRSVFIQVDSIDYLKEGVFDGRKIDSKNLYVADFYKISDLDYDPKDDLLGKGYQIVLPFTNLKTNHIYKRNRHLQISLVEDQIGVLTRFYYNNRQHKRYVNTNCAALSYSTSLVYDNALPTRITVAYGRADSLWTDYRYINSSVVGSIVTQNEVKTKYFFDDFMRLTQIKDSTNNLLLSSYSYHTWNRDRSASLWNRSTQNFVEQRTYLDPLSQNYNVSRSFVHTDGSVAGTSTAYKFEDKIHHIYSGHNVVDGWGRILKSYRNETDEFDFNTYQSIVFPELHLANNTSNYQAYNYENNSKKRVNRGADFGISINSPNAKVKTSKYSITNVLYAACELNLTADELKEFFRCAATANNRFYRVESADEDNKVSVSYTNAFGQNIASLNYNDLNEIAVTLFAYDNLGNLSKVSNPEKHINTYHYNLLNQLYQETTKESGTKKIMYNKQGLPSLFLDEELWAKKQDSAPYPQYRHFQYDIFGNLIAVGLIDGPKYNHSHIFGPLHYKTEFVGQIDNNLEGETCDLPYQYPNCAFFKYRFSNSSTQDWLLNYEVFNRGADAEFPPSNYNQQYPPTGISQFRMSKLIFDNLVLTELLPYRRISVLEKVFIYDYEPYSPTKSLLLEKRSFNLIGKEVLRNEFKYDNRLNIDKQLIYAEPNGNYSTILEVNPFQITYKYGIQRELLSQAIYTDIDQEKPAINYHYTYDGLLRLRKVSAYEKNFSNKIRTLVTYDYDDVTGNVINKKQLLSKELTSTDYIHDVRNRLTSISTIALETFDMFEQTLLYDNQLASMEVDNALHFVSSGYSYNGNIRAVQTSYHLDAVGFHDSPSNFDFPTLYGYTYDKMNRLTKADALVGDFIHNSSQISNAIKIGDEAYQFDKIGNIQRLSRTIAYSSNNSPDISKDEGWLYGYNTKNQLTMLSPTTNTVSSKAYTYDLNGNLKSDNARNLNQMTYGRSTYIYKLEQDSKKINYLYDSEDMRFYKKTQLSQNANDLLEELYIYDISGKLVAIKKMPTSQAAEYSYYLNGGSKEACLSSLNGDGEINNGEITFFLEDYLGNTRISYEPVSVVISNIPYEKLKINYVADYFPYGKILREYVNTISGNPEKFLSTQHERDLESGLDYRGARFYDSDIARFLSVDPLAEKFAGWSPYSYSFCNPIMYKDPTGKEPEKIDGDGKKKRGKQLADKKSQASLEGNDKKEEKLEKKMNRLLGTTGYQKSALNPRDNNGGTQKSANHNKGGGNTSGKQGILRKNAPTPSVPPIPNPGIIQVTGSGSTGIPAGTITAVGTQKFVRMMSAYISQNPGSIVSIYGGAPVPGGTDMSGANATQIQNALIGAGVPASNINIIPFNPAVPPPPQANPTAWPVYWAVP